MSDGLSVLYSIFCSSKRLQTYPSIKQKKKGGLHWTWCTALNPQDLKVWPYIRHSDTCMWPLTNIVSNCRFFCAGPLGFWLWCSLTNTVWSQWDTVSLLVFRSSFGQIKRIRAILFLLNMALSACWKLACWTTYVWNGENILLTPESFAPAHFTQL